MDVTKPIEFIGFGAMDVTKPYKFTGFGAIDGPKPYTFIGFGAMDVTRPRFLFIVILGVAKLSPESWHDQRSTSSSTT